MNKGFWMAKGGGHVNDANVEFSTPSRNESKRSHQWFVDATEDEIFSNKKQAVQAPNSQSSPGLSNANIPSWENPSGFQSVPNQFIDRLFGSEGSRSLNFAERNISPDGTDNLNFRRKDVDDHFGEDISVALSMSHAMDDPETCFSYGGIRKVKVNRVKDSDTNIPASQGHSFRRENNNDMSTGQAHVRESESNFISIGQAYDKEEDNVTIMGHTYHRVDAQIRSTGPSYDKGDENDISMSNIYSKEDANLISFGGFPDEHDIIPVAQPMSTYDTLYNPSSNQTSEAAPEKTSDSLNAHTVVTASKIAKLKSESASKNKPEFKTSRKEAPNSFPSNVRSLISTGMLDGVPVKYVSLSREELRGIIKGSGYLCGCQSCNFGKVLNAYEFERHAGCKTKHPNNHIYFENGKTIYQIVQELRSTPESILFDAIQTVFGAPINQKSFRIWKESYQAATRELQRIYGKEELNL
ncbi:hypothetical protein CFOL_v3_01421 [Cephalotus follicularis]|uniref:Tify domain-containing protein n=1 Tax=Cephalotus follicularis TaxID=3775 RepID=A0A1Q3AQF3_CEPFO|nr:hypothetical protein CFOL_v3_01421 [Cephalotus follicularis]